MNELRDAHRSASANSYANRSPHMMKKNPSSPSKIFKVYSPHRQESHDNSEGTQVSTGYTVGRKVNISPMKGSLMKQTVEYEDQSIHQVHQRLKDYQGSHGKTPVSKALF